MSWPWNAGLSLCFFILTIWVIDVSAILLLSILFYFCVYIWFLRFTSFYSTYVKCVVVNTIFSLHWGSDLVFDKSLEFKLEIEQVKFPDLYKTCLEAWLFKLWTELSYLICLRVPLAKECCTKNKHSVK